MCSLRRLGRREGVEAPQPDIQANPIGVFVDPAKIAREAAAGEPFDAIHHRAMAGELSPAQAPIELPAKEEVS